MKGCFTVFYVGHIKDARYKFLPHRHPTHHEIVIVTKGELEVIIKAQRLLAHCGDVLWYPVGEHHVERATGNLLESFGIGFGRRTVKPLSILGRTGVAIDTRTGFLTREHFEKPPRNVRKSMQGFAGWHKSSFGAKANLPLLRFDNNGRIENLMRWMRQIYLDQRPQTQEMLDFFLAVLLYELESDPQMDADPSVDAARQFIKENLARSMSIDDLARVAHMSKFHFARVFRQRTGVPPMNYVYQQRAEAARHLLVTTKRTIESIAYDTGFASENHLSRHIHHTFGLPPATLRRNAGKYSSAKLLDQNNVTQQ